MKVLATYTATAEIDIDLDLDFGLLDSRIFTTNDLSAIYPSHEGDSEARYLCISVEVSLDEFESALDGAAHARPRLLIILGILSFLTQELFISFEFFVSSTVKGELNRTNVADHKFEFSGIDFVPKIKQIISFIDSSKENDTRLFYSLIDRYRKALFLEKESEDSMVHDDEVLLSYFHILELLSTKYYAKQKSLALESISNLSESLLKDIFLLDGNRLQSELSSKTKLIESLFISELSVASKILFMLKEQGILTHRLKAFIYDFVKDRNSVAHGRQVYQDRVIFPVPQFFPLVANWEYSFDMLRIISGRTISLFIGLDHLEDEWIEIEDDLLPTLEEVNTFITEKRFDKISIEDFYSGKDNDITPHAIGYYLMIKKIKVAFAIAALQKVILDYREIEDEITQLIQVVVLIVDDTTDEIREKCINIIKLSSDNRWLPDVGMRDILHHLEYLGHEPKVLREMMLNREIR
ncbi:hypothetical protein [Dyadobacter fanqingshengii]|uniref:Apea-like HEPN domain-containing protein n=1 Tax=Dyadobacter fanqingshengii TaxID=2906443 RepID=A0A9X1P7B9_9BACT|nr:hypothetical protein [Dyadobacter fanqingshengii]MCF0039686.1 hypothetical protein [Dyadobacter fanqingshengii]USJ38549.1 hypothetical protein NFI81_12365 [Dyadobacter fanqingshengii]